MPNNVYIGSRYVPIFDGDWSNTKVYEALTVVNYQGSSYTSKKPVPAGTLPTNTTYWALSGNYNGQISNLQSQINDMKNGNVNGSLQKQINDMKNGNVNGSLQNQINKINNHHYLCVTDSYGETPSPSTSWVEKFAAIVGSANITKAYKGGYGFAPTGYTAPFINLITPGSVDTGVPNGYDTSKVTDIIVLGGFNDRSTAESTILTAITTFCNYARSTYTNLKNIYIGAVGWSMNSEFINELNHGNYMCAYKRCGECGAIYLSGMENVMHSFDLFQQDAPSANVTVLSHNYVHPNAYGAQYLADYLYSALKGGSADVQYPHKVLSLNCVSGIKNGSGTTIGLIERVIGDMVKIGWGVLTISHANSSAFNITGASGVIEIAAIESGYYNADNNGAYIPCTAFISGGNVTGNKAIGGDIVIYNGKVSFYYCNQDGTAYAPTIIYIYPSEGYVSLIP